MPFPIPQTEKFIMKPSSLKSQGWLGELLLFGITVFSVSLILWAGLKFGYESYLHSQIQKLDGNIQKFNQQISADDRARLVTFYSQLQNLKTLIAGHPLLTPVFAWLENATLPQVSYTRVAYSSQSRELTLNGIAKTANDATAQLKVFEAQPNVTEASFSTVTVNTTGTWTFSFTILFKTPFTVQGTPVPLQAP